MGRTDQYRGLASVLFVRFARKADQEISFGSFQSGFGSHTSLLSWPRYSFAASRRVRLTSSSTVWSAMASARSAWFCSDCLVIAALSRVSLVPPDPLRVLRRLALALLQSSRRPSWVAPKDCRPTSRRLFSVGPVYRIPNSGVLSDHSHPSSASSALSISGSGFYQAWKPPEDAR
jgi:hypothetical protein